jgi:hypothetical protein
MEDYIDLEQLRLPSNKTAVGRRTDLPRHRQGGKFLKGPIPWTWLVEAARLPGKALHVGIGLWFLAGMRRSAQVTLSMKILRSLGVSRHSAYRGLLALERAGLVAVQRHPGRNSLVTIKEHPAPPVNEHCQSDRPAPVPPIDDPSKGGCCAR